MLKWFWHPKWALHNPLKGWTLSSLKTEEARLIASTLTTAEQKVTLVLRSGWDQWKLFEHSECDSIRQQFANQSNQLEIPLPIDTISNDEVTTVTLLEPRRTALASDRKSDRIEWRLPARIILADRTFETFTEDLSSGGFRFENSLPDWVAGYFHVHLITSDKTFELLCNIVESGQSQHSRVEISMDHMNEQWVQYQNWLSNSFFNDVKKS